MIAHLWNEAGELPDDESESSCACHQRDQDGFTAWQDEAERKAILAQEEKDRLASIAKCGVG